MLSLLLWVGLNVHRPCGLKSLQFLGYLRWMSANLRSFSGK